MPEYLCKFCGTLNTSKGLWKDEGTFKSSRRFSNSTSGKPTFKENFGENTRNVNSIQIKLDIEAIEISAQEVGIYFKLSQREVITMSSSSNDNIKSLNSAGSTMGNALNFAKDYKSPKTFDAWERFHMNFIRPINGTTLLLHIYTFSNWIELFHIKKSRTLFSVNELLDKIFVERKIPDLVVTDNWPCFTSEKIKLISKTFNIIYKYNSVKSLNFIIGNKSPDTTEELLVKFVTEISVIIDLPIFQEVKYISYYDKKFIEHVNKNLCLVEEA